MDEQRLALGALGSFDRQQFLDNRDKALRLADTEHSAQTQASYGFVRHDERVIGIAIQFRYGLAHGLVLDYDPALPPTRGAFRVGVGYGNGLSQRRDELLSR